MNCHTTNALISACADDEAGFLQRLWARRHLRVCPDCASEHDALVALRARIRAEVPRYSAAPALRERVRAAARSMAPSAGSAPPRTTDSRWGWISGGALAGCTATMFAWFVGTAIVDARLNDDVATEAVALHVRATLGNNLIQVASTNQHTVKPWLSARLDYSPPVPDLAGDGVTLVGGRVDYLDRRPIATLVYRMQEHTIDVFVCPKLARAAPSAMRTVRGFNVAHATGGAMEWLAVSDVGPDELAAFVRKLADDSGPRRE
jgi:anti-sigma factor RsiW